MVCKKLSGVGFKIISYFLAILTLLFYVLLLAGCTSNSSGIPNLDLAQIQTENQTSIRFGYFGICLTSTDETNCFTTAFSSNDTIIEKLQSSANSTGISTQSIAAALELRSSAYVNILFPAAAFFAFGLIVDLLHIYSTKRDRDDGMSNSSRRRQNCYRLGSIALLWGGCAFTLAAAIGNTQTGHALQDISDSIRVGGTSLTMLWITWTISLIVTAWWAFSRRRESEIASDDKSNGKLDSGAGKASSAGNIESLPGPISSDPFSSGSKLDGPPR